MSAETSSNNHLAVALALYDAGRYHQALEVLAEALAAGHNEADVLSLAAYCHLELHDYEATLDATARLLQLNGSDVSAMNARAIALTETDRAQEAIDILVEALRLTSGDAEVLMNMSSAQLKKGNKKAARLAAAAAVERAPHLAEAHNRLGLVELQSLSPWRAQQHFERALELEPDDAGYRNNLGAALGSSGFLGRSTKHFIASAQMDPADETARDNLARNISMFVVFAGMGFRPARAILGSASVIYPIVAAAVGFYMLREVPKPIVVAGFKRVGRLWLVFPGVVIAGLLIWWGVGDVRFGMYTSIPLIVIGLVWIGLVAKFHKWLWR